MARTDRGRTEQQDDIQIVRAALREIDARLQECLYIRKALLRSAATGMAGLQERAGAWKPGWLATAIVGLLAECDEGRTTAEIMALLQASEACKISYGSVRTTLTRLKADSIIARIDGTWRTSDGGKPSPKLVALAKGGLMEKVIEP